MEKAAVISGLTKGYPNGRGIFDIDLEINRGDVFGLFGPNGAGKTTLMKCMTGLAKPDKGSIKIFGFDIASEFKSAISSVGCLVGSAVAVEHMTARDNLKLSARLCEGVSQSRIDQVLELVGLQVYKKDKVSAYSMGMKQRLGLANALLAKPQLIILDEPTNGLDIDGKLAFNKIVRELSEHEKVTFFISSHLIYEMERLCNRFGIIHDGELQVISDIGYLNGNRLEQYYIEMTGGISR